MATSTVWTVNSIRDAVRATGSHWFDPDAMRFFGTKVLPTVYQGPGGVYFVTSEQPPHGPRAHTVRKFDPETSDIDTVGELAATLSLAKAKLKARNLARAAGEIEQVLQSKEKFHEVSEAEQFLHDLHAHGNAATTAATVHKLMKAAYRHQHYCEEACNTPQGAEFAERNLPSVRRLIQQLSESVGATGVILGGDPRGCTVKLTFADGYTNDFGKEGYCVPMEEPK